MIARTMVRNRQSTSSPSRLPTAGGCFCFKGLPESWVQRRIGVWVEWDGYLAHSSAVSMSALVRFGLSQLRVDR